MTPTQPPSLLRDRISLVSFFRPLPPVVGMQERSVMEVYDFSELRR
jgi:hypothetical protein